MKTALALFTKYKYVFFSLIGGLVAGLSLLNPGLLPTHDGEYHVVRFYEFFTMLASGNWYPRWAPDLNFGYGIPLFTYVYPLPNYVASLLHVFGASFIDSFKLQMYAATVCGALFSYLWIRSLWGEKAGLVASVFYTFSPYHFVDVYVRGSVGEVWALGLFPFFLWSYTQFVLTKRRNYFFFSIFSLTCIIFSHNILAVMFFAFSITYMSYFILKEGTNVSIIRNSLFIVLISLGLSAIFWLPALFETNLVTGLQVFDTYKNFADFFQLLFPSWGTGFYGGELGNEMSVQIGIANLLVVAISFFIFIKQLFQRNFSNLLIGFFLAWFVLLFYCMLPSSILIWKMLPLMHYFQFPWRLLSLEILVCSFLAGYIGRNRSTWILVLLIGICLISTFSYAHPAYYMQRTDSYYLHRSNFIDSTNSPGNSFNTMWQANPLKRTQLVLSPTDNTLFQVKKVSPTSYVLTVHHLPSTHTIFALTYFPTWVVQTNGRNLSTKPQNGYLSFVIPQGVTKISIRQTTTTIEKIATGISFVSFIIMFLLFWLGNNKKSL